MGKSFLIDTNVLIGYIGRAIPSKGLALVAKIIDDLFIISFVNKIEVLGHPSADAELRDFVNLAKIITLSDPIVEKAIEIRKLHKTKLGDALIAATAMAENLTIATRNVSDFKNINGLKIINPWEI